MTRFWMTSSLAAAVAAGVVVHLLGAGLPYSITATVVVAVALVTAPRFLWGAMVGVSTATDLAAQMSGMDFEDYVARIARSAGLPVIMTPLSGDWGVDLIVGRRPDRLAIQCKRRARPVGAAAVQEVVAGAPMQGCTKTMVVTNHDFTPAARKLAELHGCELIGRAELPRLRAMITRLAG